MKFMESLTPQSVLFGLGLAVLTSVLGPVIKKNTKDMAVKGTQGALMAGEKISETKDKMTGAMSNMKENHENQVNTQEIFQEIKKERKQMQELVESFKELKQEMNDQNQSQQQDSPAQYK